ncbi:MAG: GntR family transcriptional regulator [Verrucomicrobiaceae bacterium]|nr:MAG: GntR family transcriptional regulator [Verrucomicrobiaceae bacterium]
MRPSLNSAGAFSSRAMREVYRGSVIENGLIAGMPRGSTFGSTAIHGEGQPLVSAMGVRKASQGAPEAPNHSISASDLAAGILCLLSSSHVRAGLRLRTVRELGLLFKVDKGKVCEALDELEEKGILIKRHGSGTFIRTVPQAKPMQGALSGFKKIRIGDILALEDDAASRRKPLRSQRNLSFQMWSYTSTALPVLETIAAGIKDVLDTAGHRMQMCAAVDSRGLALDPAVVARRLADEPADGYWVMGPFDQVFEQQFSEMGKPWISFGFSGPLRHHPGMILDCLEAVERGTQALLEGGCRRVAMLAYAGKDRDRDFELFQYSRALRGAGVADYHEVRFIKADRKEVRRAMAELLDSGTPPDGLYVADDTLLPHVAEQLEQRGIVPGRDLAVVTYWNEGGAPHPMADWSRMEISPRRFGQSLARSLLAATQSTATGLASYRILAEWCPGSTHFAASPRPVD